ncbi:MAG: adenosylcobinamide-phosphate synthase [Oleispira sp.]
MILSFFSLLLALALDYRFAEPKKYHPLVGFGRYADFLEKKLNSSANPRINSRTHFINGVLACLLAIIPILGVIIVAQHSLPNIINIFIDAGLLYLCIGWSSLQQHARAIFTELNINQLDLARTKLGWIVSRETKALDSTQISQAAVESVLENSSDALFASLFWFMVAGVEGAVLHRLINTLDAMWGYKTTQFLYFGRFSAYFDDLLNYFPARLTAYAFAFCACSVEQGQKALMCWRIQAKHCSSPNGGPVMTSGAGALNVLLSEGAFYHGKWEVKPTMGCGEVAQAYTIIESLDLVQKSLFFWLFSMGGLVFVL